MQVTLDFFHASSILRPHRGYHSKGNTKVDNGILHTSIRQLLSRWIAADCRFHGTISGVSLQRPISRQLFSNDTLSQVFSTDPLEVKIEFRLGQEHGSTHQDHL